MSDLNTKEGIVDLKWVALHGRTYSGKSTLAKALEQAGYMRIQFNDLLKEATVTAINAVLAAFGDRPPRQPVTLDEIMANKAEWRSLLQEMGVHTNFDNGGAWTEQALAPWYAAGQPPLVLDNIRTAQQAAEMMVHGISIVKLDITRAEQLERAMALGIEAAEFMVQNAHPVEQVEIYPEWIALTLPAIMPTEEQVRAIVGAGVADEAVSEVR